MKNLIKMAYRNIKNNKFKYIVISIVFILSILSGIFSLTFSDIAVKTREEQLRKNTLNTQLSIVTKDEENIYFSKDNVLEKIKDTNGIKEISPRIGGQAFYNEDILSFVGMDMEKQKKVYKFNYEDKLSENFSDDSILISKSFADKYSKNIGDLITLKMNDKEYPLKIIGILKDDGTF